MEQNVNRYTLFTTAECEDEPEVLSLCFNSGLHALKHDRNSSKHQTHTQRVTLTSSDSI